MYLAKTTNDTTTNWEEFVNVPDLVNHYNTNLKGTHEVEVYEGLQDCLGEVLVGEFIFRFYTDDYGDLT